MILLIVVVIEYSFFKMSNNPSRHSVEAKGIKPAWKSFSIFFLWFYFNFKLLVLRNDPEIFQEFSYVFNNGFRKSDRIVGSFGWSYPYMVEKLVLDGQCSLFDVKDIQCFFTVSVNWFKVVMNRFSDLYLIENLFVILHVWNAIWGRF